MQACGTFITFMHDDLCIYDEHTARMNSYKMPNVISKTLLQQNHCSLLYSVQRTVVILHKAVKQERTDGRDNYILFIGC